MRMRTAPSLLVAVRIRELMGALLWEQSSELAVLMGEGPPSLPVPIAQQPALPPGAGDNFLCGLKQWQMIVEI